MSFLKPKAKSNNQAYGYLKDQYGGTIGQGKNATNILSTLLTGQGDQGAADGAWENYKGMAGYAPALADTMRGVTGGAAAQGQLRSGAAGRSYVREGAKLNSGMFGNFLQQLSGLSGIGLNAGQLIGGSGSGSLQPSTGSKILGAVGKVASIFSDPRTKRDILKLTEFEDGLGVYRFRYLDDDEPRIGVMADEVAEIRPWALGPVIGGFMTVNYAAL